MQRNLRVPVAFAAALFLAGCATVDIDGAVQDANQSLPGFTQGKLELSRTQHQRARREQLAEQFLSAPLTMDAAVQLALANSPSFQAVVAEGWGQMAVAEQGGRIANP